MRLCSNCQYEKLHGSTNPCAPCKGYSHWEPKAQPEPAKKTALTWQEGGQHYKDKAIQPIVYIHANKLGFCEGNVVKYITRHKEKNGAEDIRKVIHYCELLLELEYKNE
jgi:hypothetical protein